MKPVFTVVIAVTLGLSVVAPGVALGGQELPFSLSVGQSVTVGSYVLQFQGLTANRASYALYSLSGALLVSFVSDPARPSVFRNVAIMTTSITPDGKRASGTVTLE